ILLLISPDRGGRSAAGALAGATRVNRRGPNSMKLESRLQPVRMLGFRLKAGLQRGWDARSPRRTAEEVRASKARPRPQAIPRPAEHRGSNGPPRAEQPRP